MAIMKKRLLVISNNVLSTTHNNGKTILSYIDCIQKENVRQLYFNAAMPDVEGYSYFQLTDRDIIHGLFDSEKRGRVINKIVLDQREIRSSNVIRRTPLTLFLRDILWNNKWNSKNLTNWLDDFQPEAIFFVAGDNLFTYRICSYLTKKYGSRLTVYMTDDYIIPRKKESLLYTFRRVLIKKNLCNLLADASCFFTISKQMQRKYKEYLGYDSKKIVNLTESMKMDVSNNNERIELIYAGSLYYGRDLIIGKISESIDHYNRNHKKKAFLKIYSNQILDDKSLKIVELQGSSQYCGSLNKDELTIALNQSDILVFVESFEEQYIEKTMYSLSTKVPEYLSVGKAILAIGPKEVGSMDYLSDAAYCISDYDAIDKEVGSFFDNEELRDQLGVKAQKKYAKFHNKEQLQKMFIENVLGN